MSKSLTFYQHFPTLSSASHTPCVTNVCVVCVCLCARRHSESRLGSHWNCGGGFHFLLAPLHSSNSLHKCRVIWDYIIIYQIYVTIKVTLLSIFNVIVTLSFRYDSNTESINSSLGGEKWIVSQFTKFTKWMRCFQFVCAFSLVLVFFWLTSEMSTHSSPYLNCILWKWYPPRCFPLIKHLFSACEVEFVCIPPGSVFSAWNGKQQQQQQFTCDKA